MSHCKTNRWAYRVFIVPLYGRCLNSYLVTMKITAPQLWCCLILLPMNAVLNYIFLYHLDLGFAGTPGPNRHCEPSKGDQIVFFNCRDLHHERPDSGGRQLKSKTCNTQFDPPLRAGVTPWTPNSKP